MNRRIAVIGASFRLPGTSPENFWQALLDKTDLVTEVDEQRWSKDAYLHPDKQHPGSSYTFAAGSIGDISGFDAAFFGISPREAAMMDPQQRLLLQLAWEAIESAGVAPTRLRGSDCGVFVGISSPDNAYRSTDDLASVSSASGTGNTLSIAANRISYQFDLHGPSMAVDTACSSSLVAFHQAVRSLLSGESSMALAGGIGLHLHPYGFISFSKATMLSPKGRCQVFDADGDGYVRSEGGGLFLLKDYEQAVADGDPILAIVAATGVNTDGHKSGLTVPNPVAQKALLERVYREAGVDPNEIHYLEAHGTGTAVGDPIETRAIGEALGQKRGRPLPIGSVKSNLGHLEAASGVAGLVKAIYSLKNRCVPATISMKTPNPKIHFDEWNIDVVQESLPLPEAGILTIGVNSFGFGGANAHVILQSAPEQDSPSDQNAVPTCPLPLLASAADEPALEAYLHALAEQLQTEEVSFYDLAWSSAFRRESHKQGALLFAQDHAQAAEQIRDYLNADDRSRCQISFGTRLEQPGKLAFVFSGNGCQWFGMGRQLLERSALFADTLRDIDRWFEPLAGFSLSAELKGENGDRLQQTEIAQPTLFAVQVGITQLLRSEGVEADAVMGHSVGEVAAAWASGALTLQQAVQVIYHRSRHQGLTRGQGGMTAVGVSAEAISAEISRLQLGAVCLAGDNSSRGATLAGDPEQLAQLESLLESQQQFCRRLDLDYAFHSPAMDPICAGVQKDLAQLVPSACGIPFVSTVTGGYLQGEQLDAEYWWKNIREPVRFRQAVEQLVDAGYNLFVEIGAHPVLRSYLQDGLREAEREGLVIASLTRGGDASQEWRAARAKVWLSGYPIDLKRWFPVQGQVTALPSYPWQLQTLNLPVSSESYGLVHRRYVHPLLGYALPQHELTWENLIDTGRYPWLADHQVGDGVVFPGAGYVELLLAAIAQQQTDELVEFEGLEILSPLLLDYAHSKVVRVSCDAQTGQLRIRARTQASDESWTEQVRARWRREPLGSLLQSSRLQLPMRAADFAREAHQQLTRSIGLGYGPAFSRITQGWLEGAWAIGEIEQDPLDDEGWLLNPGILDSAFQLAFQLMRTELQAHNELAFVPTRLERVLIRQGGQPRFARAKILRRAPHSITARFELFDADRHCIACVEQARFKAIRLRKTDTLNLDRLAYVWIPPRQDQTAPEMSDRWPQLGKRIAACWDDSADLLRYQEELDPLFEAYLASALREAFTDLAEAGRLSLNRLAPAASRWLDLLVDFAEHQGVVERADSYLQLLDEPDATPANTIWQLMLRDYGADLPLLLPLGRLGRSFKALLTGEMNAAALSIEPALYPALCQHALGELSWQGLAESLAGLVEQVRESSPEHRLRMLELGACALPVTERLQPLLDLRQIEVQLLPLERGAAQDAERLQQREPLLHIVSSNDAAPADLSLYWVESTDQNLLRDQLRTALNATAVDGRLLIAGLAPSHWKALLLGASENWWTAGAFHQQPGEELIRELLHQLGVTEVQSFTPATGAAYLLSVGGFAKQGVAERVQSERWLFCGSAEAQASEWAEKLAARLEKAGQRVVWLTTSPQASMALPSRLEHLVLLPERGGLVDTQQRRCALAAELVRACETAQLKPSWWLLTESVGETLGVWSDQPCAEAAPDSAFWGFGRTLMNELGDHTVKLLDLPALAGDDALQTLVDEICAPSAEAELLIGPQGERRVPRLRLLEPEASNPSHGAQISLGFSQPGQLRNLQWQAHDLPEVAEDEIEVAVRATGLNFRDVMYTLGLLADEAIENGFAGPTLGLEFAGEVTRVGAAIEKFAVGDRVVGFGPASFSNRVITRTQAVTAIPPGLSFESAATIPSTFFTVYYALHHLARVQPGERVLIHGAAGGVGIAAIQIARWLGAEIYATAGSDAKRDFLRLLGVDHLYDSRSLHFAEQIVAETPDGLGVDVVLNSLAGEAINRNLQLLKPLGRFLELGKRDFYDNTAIGLRPFRNNISYFGIDADQVMQECPALTERLFAEMMQLFHDGTLYPLPYSRFDANRVEEAFRFMQQARQIGKVVVNYPQGVRQVVDARSPIAPSLQLDPGASYLVTGGLGGFGLRTAVWLAEKGARHLLLLSRRGSASLEAQEQIALLRAQGCQVEAIACDVTERDALAAVVERCGCDLPKLKGVVHAAAVIEDALIRNLDSDQIQRVFAAKMQGAAHLDQLTRDLDLDLFVLFSSATTLLGNPGQSAYVAANHWLESLAAQRRQAGLPALAVLWGAIDDAGFLARNETIKEALTGRMGGGAIPSAQALQELEKLLVEKVPVAGVMPLEWPALQRFLPSAWQPKFAEIAACADEEEGDHEGTLDLVALLNEQGLDAVERLLVNLLKQELARILLLSEEQIDPQRSVYDMGLDSLMGVELMVAIENRIGVNVPVMVLSEAPTLEKLARYLISRCEVSESAQDGGMAQMAARHGISAAEQSDLQQRLESNESQLQRIIH